MKWKGEKSLRSKKKKHEKKEKFHIQNRKTIAVPFSISQIIFETTMKFYFANSHINVVWWKNVFFSNEMEVTIKFIDNIHSMGSTIPSAQTYLNAIFFVVYIVLYSWALAVNRWFPKHSTWERSFCNIYEIKISVIKIKCKERHLQCSCNKAITIYFKMDRTKEGEEVMCLCRLIKIREIESPPYTYMYSSQILYSTLRFHFLFVFCASLIWQVTCYNFYVNYKNRLIHIV